MTAPGLMMSVCRRSHRAYYVRSSRMKSRFTPRSTIGTCESLASSERIVTADRSRRTSTTARSASAILSATSGPTVATSPAKPAAAASVTCHVALNSPARAIPAETRSTAPLAAKVTLHRRCRCRRVRHQIAALETIATAIRAATAAETPTHMGLPRSVAPVMDQPFQISFATGKRGEPEALVMSPANGIPLVPPAGTGRPRPLGFEPRTCGLRVD